MKGIETHDGSAAGVYCGRGVAYADKGDFDAAIADYNKTIELNPANADVYDHRGNAYIGKGNFGAAIVDFSKAIA